MRVYNLLATFFKYCIKERHMTYTPLDNVNIPRMNVAIKKKNLTTEEVDLLVEAYRKDSSLLIE